MPGRDSPHDTEHHGQIPPDELDRLGEREVRVCRVCQSEISDPLPNQFRCRECEDLDAENPEVEQTDHDGTEEPDLIPEGESGPGPSRSDLPLEEAVEASDLPPIEMKPSHREELLDRIDGAGNEAKFRTLHLDGDWSQIYDESDYEEPFRVAVGGYLAVVAFYTRLHITHMEALYRASAMYDSDFWNGWARLERLENAVNLVTEQDEGYRIYGREAGFQERLAQARSQLDLIERQMNR